MGRAYTFGPFSIDADSRLLFRNGERLSLPPKAADVLIAILKREGQLVTKDDEGLKVLWLRLVLETPERAGEFQGLMEKELEKRLKARAKK